jgi:hypothetical protein
MMRQYSQIKARKNNYITILNTAWLYPPIYVKSGLASTTFKYVYSGDLIICPTMNDLIGVYSDIYSMTTIAQPNGNVGFTVGEGTLLEDMGDELRFCLTNGQVIIVWRLVKQLTLQSIAVIPVAGNSPNETIGYVTTFCSYGNGTGGGYVSGLDDVQVVRLG